MDNPEKLATCGTQDTSSRQKNKQKTQPNMCWVPLCTGKDEPMIVLCRIRNGYYDTERKDT
jgi:hypothetical protein